MSNPVIQPVTTQQNMTVTNSVNSIMYVISLLVLYSPIYLAFSFGIVMSVVFQNFSGFIYLGFLIAVSVLRDFVSSMSGVQADPRNITACSNMERLSGYGNSSFSVFVFSFTIFYICLPMFLNNNINYFVFGSLLAYMIIDIMIRYQKQCLTNVTTVLINILCGSILGITIPALLYAGGSSKYLMFTETTSNKEVCSMPKKQQFKCAVYKNGEIIGSTSA